MIAHLRSWLHRRKVRRVLERAEILGWTSEVAEWAESAGHIDSDSAVEARAGIAEYMASYHGPEAAEIGLARQVAEAFERGRGRWRRERLEAEHAD